NDIPTSSASSPSPSTSSLSSSSSSSNDSSSTVLFANSPSPSTATPSTSTPTSGAGTILICRNKHFPYIASYHGPWLSLPHELFQSLIDINSSTKPHPIDATVFKNLFTIRRLVDEAAELAIRAVSSLPGPGFMGGNSHHPHHHNHHHNHHHHQHGGNGFGRVSHMRQNRLRELACAKLAQAYRIDEIATSVLAMQSASALDDIASKVSTIYE
ncbi:hypothetical protein BC829DRAFT_400305, partial [Chytridium lagenaria]